MNADDKPLRADAERNRQAILSAAGAVFAAKGTGVTLEHIADVAGVGVGTIYRRFPTVSDLVAVVLEAKMSQYADRTEAAAEEALAEPWNAFREYVLYIVEQQAQDLGFSDVLLSPKTGTELFRAEMQRALLASILLVRRVRAAGAIRPDFDHSDLYMLTRATSGLIGDSHRGTPLAWRRLTDYMLQSFGTAGGESLTPPATHVG